MTEPTNLFAASVGDNAVLFWGIRNNERTRRIAVAAGHSWSGSNADHAQIIANDAFAFDPLWYRHVAAHPGLVLTKNGVPVIAHCPDEADASQVAAAMTEQKALPVQTGLQQIAIESGPQVENKELRKLFTPFADTLAPENVRALERASYFGAYKGVTDILTKYLWPEWALVLTRLAARMGISPNQVTGMGFILCLVAMYLFWIGHYWWGMGAALIFMVFDTVDGKLARCTITSSRWGNVFDHGIDLIHPPFWWWAWAMGLESWGLALSASAFKWVMIAVFGGYVFQRLIEGQFIVRNDQMHIHVWEKIDSQFRLITARRNPNMVILFAATVFARPDIGLICVAWWTALSCLFHLVRLIQAEFARARGSKIRSWMEA